MTVRNGLPKLTELGVNMSNIENFQKELTNLINKHSLDNDANTPDYILSNILTDVLTSIIVRTKERDDWYNTDHDIGNK